MCIKVFLTRIYILESPSGASSGEGWVLGARALPAFPHLLPCALPQLKRGGAAGGHRRVVEEAAAAHTQPARPRERAAAARFRVARARCFSDGGAAAHGWAARDVREPCAPDAPAVVGARPRPAGARARRELALWSPLAFPRRAAPPRHARASAPSQSPVRRASRCARQPPPAGAAPRTQHGAQRWPPPPATKLSRLARARSRRSQAHALGCSPQLRSMRAGGQPPHHIGVATDQQDR